MATNDIYASFTTSGGGGGVAVTPPGDTAPTIYITGAGMSTHDNGLVAMLPNLTKTYVANPRDNSVSVVNNSTNTAETGTGYPIAVGAAPTGIAATPDGNYVLVANMNDPSVSIIDPATDTVTSTITASDGLPATPAYIAVTPDSTTAYVTHQTTPSQISAIDLTMSPPALKTGTGYPITTNLSASIEFIAIDPTGYNAYVAANPFEGAVDVIDLTVSPPIVRTGSTFPIPLSTGAFAVEVSPDGTEVWVTDDGDATISVISTAANLVTTTYSVDTAHFGNIVFSADSSLAYIPNLDSGTISEVDTANGSVSNTITFSSGYAPNAVAIAQALPPLPPTLFLCSAWFG